MELTDDFYNDYKIMLAGVLFNSKKIDYLCYQYILKKYMKDWLDESY